MWCHRSRIQCYLSHPEDSTPAVSCCRANGGPVLYLGWLWGNPDIVQMLHTPILLIRAPTICHGRNGYTQLNKTRSTDDTMRLFQINDLVMFGYACPSHFRPGLSTVICALIVLPVTHLKPVLRIHNVCHCFMSLNRNEVWRVINFSTYWKRSILSNVLLKIEYSPQIQVRWKMKLKKRPVTFNKPCACHAL